ncbi:hypothetical protein [Tistrella mobilis]|uniref:Uncharacterized protein n=1 Tax=Tistrella mobilis (strain KA081020-065) TaxID=1110502 RepID=I3TID5_TISMK|nr:hypothetical protein [Tistrella mobilis]AFK52523.1 hypothetical protein TMO_0684 [Tistrella mobilis KA081020-065]
MIKTSIRALAVALALAGSAGIALAQTPPPANNTDDEAGYLFDDELTGLAVGGGAAAAVAIAIIASDDDDSGTSTSTATSTAR